MLFAHLNPSLLENLRKARRKERGKEVILSKSLRPTLRASCFGANSASHDRPPLSKFLQRMVEGGMHLWCGGGGHSGKSGREIWIFAKLRHIGWGFNKEALWWQQRGPSINHIVSMVTVARDRCVHELSAEHVRKYYSKLPGRGLHHWRKVLLS